MMRRRLASRGRDLCFFCSFRSTLESLNAQGSRSRHARTYISSNTPLRRPYGAATAEKDDEDEPRIFRPSHGQTARFDQQRNRHNLFSREPHPPSQTQQANGEPAFKIRYTEMRRDTFPSAQQGSPENSSRRQEQHSSRQDGVFPDRRIDSRRYEQQAPGTVRESGGTRLNGRAFGRQSQSQSGHTGLDAFSHAVGAMGDRHGQRASFDTRPADGVRDTRRERPHFDRPPPRSQNSYSGFDAFSQAIRDTGKERSTLFGNRFSDRSIGDRGRPLDRGRFGDAGRDRRPLGRRTGQLPERPKPGTESVVENMVTEEPGLSVIDGGVDEVDSRRKKDRATKRAARSDRYATEEDDEVDMASSGHRGKPAKNRMTQEERDMERLEEEMTGGGGRRKKQKKKTAQKPAEQSNLRRLEIPEFITVQNMSQALGLRLETFLDKLEEEGFEDARHDHLLDSGTAAMFAEVYGFEPVLATSDAQVDLVARPPPEDPSVLPQRPPIVTIMGHVDHGKTTILDYLRKANVVASEHGGITQHIGAFSVTMPGTQRNITFLDTPGHAAFLDMRRRGANVTDIVVLVVAADDSVKPQTEEAIKHAQEAGVQIIVAINKVDKDDADIDRVKQDLSRHNIIVEDYGGDYQAIPLSGKTGQGMDQLEEAIVTLADVSDFRAETDGPAEGWIIESKLTLAGRVATVLVRRGTLRPGDFIVAGNTWARVRTLHNDKGESVSEAPPGTPVQIDGWRGEDPTAGLEVLQADDEQHAKEVVDLRLEKAEALRNATDMAAINAARSEAAEARAKVLEWQREQGFASNKQARIRLRENTLGWVETEQQGGPRKVHFVIKADVAGSTEAVEAAVRAIGNSEVQANVIHSGTGHLTESDIRLLATTGEVGYAISFNQQVDGTIYRLAEAAGLEIIDHNIIYKVTDIVTEKVAAELPPLITFKVLGEAEIGQIFDVTVKKVKHKIAGCRVTNGTISRAEKVRVLRGEEVVYTGTLDSLKNVKKDVSEMRKGTECGMAFDGWEDMQEGDKVQCFEEISEKRKLY